MDDVVRYRTRRLLKRAASRIRWRSNGRLLRLRAKPLPRNENLWIHVGASDRRLDGWVNTDVDGSAKYFLDVTRPWPVAPGSVAYVFADNVIEHLTLEAGRRFLAHAHAAMRPGGTIRLVTPDVGANARAYVEHGIEASALLDRHRRNGYKIEHDVDILRVVFAESGHAEGYLFDEAALRAEFARAGFAAPRSFDPGQSNEAALRGIDGRTDPIDAVLLLTMEAVRQRD